MISLLHLNKLLYLALFIYSIFFTQNMSIAAVDIWKKKENNKKIEIETDLEEQDITIESPIISEDINKIIIRIDEKEIGDSGQSVIGIIDPEVNNFNLDMWSSSNGEDIKKILKRIDKLKLSKLSEDLLLKFYLQMHTPQKKT